MKQRIPRRVLSAFLALVLLISCVPPVYAAEAVTEPLTVAEETEAPVAAAAETTQPEETEAEIPDQTEPVTEPAQQTEAAEETTEQETVSEETVPQETVAEETLPAQTLPEETVPEETTSGETVPEETVPEDTAPVELPYGFAGLPEGYVLGEENAALKQDMIEHNVLEAVAGMTAGEQYKEGCVLIYAETEEEAALYAAAFSGELVSYRSGIGAIQLLTATVYEAVEASLNPEYNLPAVNPNYISHFEPIEQTEVLTAPTALPEQRDWYYWVKEVLGSNADPGLEDFTKSSYQWMHDTVGSYAAWGVTTGQKWVKVAVIDTGIDMSHEELSDHIDYIDIGLGTADVAGHGTHVAGIIAGTLGNNKGGAGIAPGVSLINICAYTPGEGFLDEDLAVAIRAAADKGAHVINMSLGGPGYNSLVQNAINYAVGKGVTIIAAMSNEGSNLLSYPAGFDNVIAVAATSRNNNRAYFSNFGPWADIAAPGDDIYSCVPVADGSYDIYDGTSMAAPVVAGVAALYTSAMGKRVDPATMEKVMESTATKISESGCGAGIVNIANMLDGVPEAPYYVITDGKRDYKATEPIPCDATVYFYESQEVYENGYEGDVESQMICTIDGKAPAVKDGVLVYGTALKDPVSLNLSSFAGTKVTAKVARMSGMGIMGKTLTLNLNVVGHDDVGSITIHGSKKLIPGKSCVYTATVSPVGKADQAVTWEMVSSTVSGAKINAKTGKLTTVASGGSGEIRIRATSVADPSVRSSIFTVKVATISPVASITLNKTADSLFVGKTGTVSVSSMVDKDGSNVSVSTSGVQWTSSNTKVLTIDANGKYTAKAKGTATVTCTALDGSGKKATCKITVLQPVEAIEISGQGSIAPGTAAAYKATAYPTTANNKKVTWGLYGDPGGVSVDAKTGKVTVDRSATTEKSFYVRAYATDGSGEYASFKVVIRGKCSNMYIGRATYSGKAAGVQYSGKSVKAVNLFSRDLDSSSGADNKTTLSCYSDSPGEYMCFSWTSSAPHIASVDANGVVTAHKAGKATITLIAEDGSNKKATCTINVTNPASYISISTKSANMSTGRYMLAAGKSVANTAVFANTFGKPTNQKVNWSYSVYEMRNGEIYKNRTSDFSGKKLISLSSSGKLSTKKGAGDLWWTYDGPIMIRVFATATDGTGVKGYIDYMLIPETTVVMPEYNSYTYNSKSYAYSQTMYFISDQWPGMGYGFNATSSNPKVVSCYEIAYTGYGYEGLYLYELTVAIPGPKGSATINIKAADGSNKGCSVKVTVK